MILITAFKFKRVLRGKTFSMNYIKQTDLNVFFTTYISFQMANLSDLENHREMFQHLPLYEAGLLELKHGHVPCRTLRCISITL